MANDETPTLHSVGLDTLTQRVSCMSMDDLLVDITDFPSNPSPEDWSDSLVFKLLYSKPIKVFVFLRTMERVWNVAPDTVEFGCMKTNMFAAKFQNRTDLDCIFS